MSILQSDTLNSFIDQSISTNNHNNQPNDDSYNPLLQYDENIYDLLLKSKEISLNDDDDLSPINQQEKSLTNNNLHLFNYKFQNQPSAPCHTINPKELNPNLTATTATTTAIQSNIISSSNSSHSTSEFEYNDHDSITSESADPLTQSQTSISSNSITPSTTFKSSSTNNWSMNDEFKDAIATWINQNQPTTTTTTTSRSKKSMSISHHSPTKFIKTSITKRRKSDSTILLPTFSIPTINQSINNNHSLISDPISTSMIPESIEDKLHLQSNEEEEKPFKCESCPKAFRRSEHLKRHVRSVHSNVRPFPCKFCEKKFSRSDNLAQHLRTHNKH